MSKLDWNCWIVYINRVELKSKIRIKFETRLFNDLEDSINGLNATITDDVTRYSTQDNCI